ncbi:MAG: hypothetical protein QXI02_02950 [Candidatus Caldarchaeum sp.]
MKSWFLSNGLTILLVVLPILLPNKTLYRWVRRTVGRIVRLITVKAEAKGLVGLLSFVLNTIATVCSAVSDEVRGVPSLEEDGVPAGEKVRGLAKGRG